MISLKTSSKPTSVVSTTFRLAVLLLVFSFPIISIAKARRNTRTIMQDFETTFAGRGNWLADAVGLVKEIPCEIHEDCPSHLACFGGPAGNGNTCRDPCNLVRFRPWKCGKNALCEVVDHERRCACPEGYHGNPEIRCFDFGLRSPQYLSGRFSECEDDSDCPEHLGCSSDDVCRDFCIHIWHGLNCGVNAACKMIKNTPACACKEGYTGNPLVHCSTKPPPRVLNILKESTVEQRCHLQEDCPIHMNCSIAKVCIDRCNSQHTEALRCPANSVCRISVNDDHKAICDFGTLAIITINSTDIP